MFLLDISKKDKDQDLFLLTNKTQKFTKAQIQKFKLVKDKMNPNLFFSKSKKHLKMSKINLMDFLQLIYPH